MFSNTVSTDTTSPTISAVTIASNNANTTLAKTNNTITVSLTTADNLSPEITLENASILNKPITSNAVNGATGAAKNFARFTDGSETSQTVVPFSFQIKDEAGNFSSTKTTTDNASSVKFDRTDPLVSNVKISAISADASAKTDEIPQYYAKAGDTINFELQTCDYTDTTATPPQGTIFGVSKTLTDAGTVSNAATCSKGNGDTGLWRKWTTQLTGIDGSEGTINFNFTVVDNSGNEGKDGTTENTEPGTTNVPVTGTTDGSSIIFDKTKPSDSSLTTVDLLGASTATFKHRKNAKFSWSGASDNLSGIWKYHGKIENTHTVPNSNQNFANFLSSSWTPLTLHPKDADYKLSLQIQDKAGNITAEKEIYSQKYTIGITGTITDSQNQIMENVLVQVVARYGEECDTGKVICTGYTDANGEYGVVVKKNQNYNVTCFKDNYYLAKSDLSVAETDTVNDIQLQKLRTILEKQTMDQTITIVTDRIHICPDGKKCFTKIYIQSLSGEVEISYSNDDMIITSLSEITSVTSNDSSVTISGSGTSWSAHNVGKEKYNPSGKAKNFSSGNSALGVVAIPAYGYNVSRRSGDTLKNRTKTNIMMTPAEAAADLKRLNTPTFGTLKSYTNENGFEIFAGYQQGKRLIQMSDLKTIAKSASKFQKAQNLPEKQIKTTSLFAKNKQKGASGVGNGQILREKSAAASAHAAKIAREKENQLTKKFAKKVNYTDPRKFKSNALRAPMIRTFRFKGAKKNIDAKKIQIR